MGKRTGRPRGRPKGAQSKFTKERQAKVQETAQMLNEVLPEPFEGDSHAFLMAIYKDPRNPLDVRLDAAKAAIGYEKPRLASSQVTMDADITNRHGSEPVSDTARWIEETLRARADRQTAQLMPN